MDPSELLENLLFEWEAMHETDATLKKLQKQENIIVAMIKAEFPRPFHFDGEIIDMNMDSVWSPFLFTIVVDALPVAVRLLDAFPDEVSEDVLATGMLQAQWSGAHRCMALLGHRGAPPPSLPSQFWPVLERIVFNDYTDSQMARTWAYWKLEEILKDGYCDVEEMDESGRTIFAKAVDRGLFQNAMQLLEAGANPMASLPDGRTALYALWEHPDVAAQPWLYHRLEVRNH